jgi:hypothetical protein
LEYFKTVVTPDKLRISQEYLRRSTVWSDLCALAQTVVAVMAPQWQPQFGNPVFARIRISPELLFSSASARRRKLQPVSESTSMAGPVELFSLFEESSDVYGLPEPSRLAYRHLGNRATPSERNR